MKGSKSYTHVKQGGIGEILPSTQQVQWIGKEVEMYGDIEFPYTLSKLNSIGEIIHFQEMDVLHASVKLAGLEEVVSECLLQTSDSYDSANFSKHLGFVMAGIKVTEYNPS